MSRLFNAKTSFSSGELSPELLGRGEIKAYADGAMKLKNVFIHSTGGVSRRAGLKYLDTVQGKGKLVTFEFNTEQIYLLVFTDERIDVYMNDEKVADFAVPWTEEQLEQVKWTQSADALLVVHPDTLPKKITRTSHSVWNVSDWEFFETEDSFLNQPYYRFADTAITLQPSALTGTVTITASASVFNSSHVGVRLRFSDGEAEITSYSSSTSVQALVKVDFSVTDATKDWKEQAFSAVHGYPATVTYHQDRLVIGGSRDLPNTLWLSKTSDLMNFDLGEGLDDEAIEFTILSDQVNAIKAVFSGRHLQVFTSGAEWMVSGEPLTPSEIQLKRQTRIGSCYVPPIDVDGATVFVSANGTELREFLFADVEQAYQANDIAMLSRHLMNSPVSQSYNSADRLLTLVMADGKIAVVTNYRLEDVTAWTGCETEGSFLSVTEAGTKTYVLVERFDDVFLEVFDSSFGVDSAVFDESSSPKQVWDGFSHLEGKTVKVLADGNPVEDCVVDSGEISLAFPASEVRAGLAFTHEITPLPPMLSVAGGARPPRSIRLVEVCFRVIDTMSIQVDTGKGIKTVPLKNFGNDVLDVSPSDFSGDIRIKAFGWIKNFLKPAWKIKGDSPLSCTVLSVTTEMKVND